MDRRAGSRSRSLANLGAGDTARLDIQLAAPTCRASVAAPARSWTQLLLPKPWGYTQSCAEKSLREIINYVPSPEDQELTVDIHNKHLLGATQREKTRHEGPPWAGRTAGSVPLCHARASPPSQHPEVLVGSLQGSLQGPKERCRQLTAPLCSQPGDGGAAERAAEAVSFCCTVPLRCRHWHLPGSSTQPWGGLLARPKIS